MYNNGEHCWECNMTFSVAYTSMTVHCFLLTNFSTNSSQHDLSTIAEAVDTISQDSRFLHMASPYHDHVQLGASHVTFPKVFTDGLCTV